MSSKKVQEMVQTDRSGSVSPFWRTNSNSNKKGSSSGSQKVIGASYSHADILKFDQLSVSRSNSIATRDSGGRPSSAASNKSPERKHGYQSFEPGQDSDWLAAEDPEDDDEDVLALDEDEDEFGLPSIASMRRKGKRNNNKKAIDPGGFRPPPVSSSGYSPSLGTWGLDNGDIAEERSLPNYPTAKKSEGKILRPQYKDILRDPANSLHLISHPSIPSNATSKERDAHSARIGRINRFKRLLQASNVSIAELRNLAWSGIPEEVRAMSWQILLGYLPTNSERRVATLERKRKEYMDGVRQAFERGTAGSDAPVETSLMAGKPSNQSHRSKGRGLDEAIWHQISIDVPRTNPHLELYGYEATQRSLERILYVWAIRHPASGYVQGINDLVTPFWQVFLGSYITDPDIEFGMDPGQLPKQVLDAVEADSYWCLTKLLDGIQDNYIAAQPGIQRSVAALRDLTTRIDEKLAKHLEAEGVEFIQFSFRWMNCLMMRELSIKSIIRMWDTYLAEDQGFSHFHLYVCAAFLVKWSEKLLKMDFQEMMMFLQSLPTKYWTEKDIELLLSEAFIWQSLFRGSKGHIQKSASGIGPLTL
ncbi:hypothetical protein B9Z65_5191 [Elsinoe australis]|uniref:Rab-GAP TBC domain-containing protein n=1 Tax=Elsinoe australis TaxID=40998 RepID=A0A2P7ZDD3_9PEZI|nr:hypothetical protein B9Z65_5191 [Elsinoe australis]